MTEDQILKMIAKLSFRTIEELDELLYMYANLYRKTGADDYWRMISHITTAINGHYK